MASAGRAFAASDRYTPAVLELGECQRGQPRSPPHASRAARRCPSRPLADTSPFVFSPGGFDPLCPFGEAELAQGRVNKLNPTAGGPLERTPNRAKIINGRLQARPCEPSGSLGANRDDVLATLVPSLAAKRSLARAKLQNACSEECVNGQSSGPMFCHHLHSLVVTLTAGDVTRCQAPAQFHAFRHQGLRSPRGGRLCDTSSGHWRDRPRPGGGVHEPTLPRARDHPARALRAIQVAGFETCQSLRD